MEGVLFSIIITTYNRKDYLERCLKSLLDQNYKNFEVFVYDDGSSDGTREWVEANASIYKESFVRFEYQWNENWGGPARGRNVGLNWAKGEWCSFLDSDDWYYPNRLERVLYETKESDVVYHELQYSSKLGVLKKTTNGRILPEHAYKDLLIYGNCLSNSATSFRLEIAREVGGVSEDSSLKAAEDYDFWLKIAKVTNKFKYIPEVLGCYWIGDDNISAPSLGFIDNLKFVVNKHVENLSEDEQKEAQIRLDYIEARNLMMIDDLDLKKRAKVLFGRIMLSSKSVQLRAKSLYCWIKL